MRSSTDDATPDRSPDSVGSAGVTGTASAQAPAERAVPRGIDDLPDSVDVLVVGAGISGISATHRILEAVPGLRVAVVEARERTGGTWDLFRYPGVRSDSDMHTLSFPFRPWAGEQTIADGPEILEYLKETAREVGVAERVHHGCRVVAARWSTPEQRWEVDLESDGPDGPRRRTITAWYVHLGSGYYDYEEAHDPGFIGIEDFTAAGGQVIHPQHWPEGLDLTGRRAVVIGSGATAISLVPALAQTAAHVTMLQRTPSYVLAQPGRDVVVDLMRRARVPETAVHRVARTKNLAMSGFMYRLSRKRPAVAKKLVLGALRRQLSAEVVDEHFTPPYGVWDQRLCVVRDGDLFAEVGRGAVDVATGHIDRFVAGGVRLTDGRLVEADLVVTATGLKLKALGGISFTVDGRPVDLARTYAYRGVMLSGVPNASMSVGYTNASWTLRADLVSGYVARLLSHLRDRDLGVAVPVAPEGMTAGPILDITAGYVQRAIGAFPKVGDRPPWTMPQDYKLDRRVFPSADVTEEMHFVPKGAAETSVPTGAAAPAEIELPGSSSNVGQEVTDAPVSA